MENISKLTPILYEKNETNFNHNGLGKLTKLLVNEIDEVLNGEFEALFEYPANGRLADKIDNEMFIKAKPNKKDEPHVFKIYDYELDTFTQTYLIYARSKNIEDLKNNVILDVNVKNLSPTQAWNLAKNNALDPVVTTFYSDITTASSVHWERRSLLSTIAGQEGSMIQYWGGEIKHGINRISLFRRRGQDNVTTVRHGKNLDGLKATYSTKGLVTAIVPYYVKGDDKSIYGDVVKSQYINNYPSTYYDIIEYNDEALGLSREDEPESGYSDSTIKTALNKVAKRYFDENIGKDLPSINMEISLEDISQTKEYEQFKDFEQIEIGDTITVYSKKFNVNINAKVRRVVYNGLTDKNELVEVGTARRSFYDDVRDDFKKVETELQEGIDHAMTSANGKNTNYYGTADPNEVGLVGQNNDNYFRTNGQLKELWIYRDGMWYLEVGDLTGEQIRAEVEQAQQEIAEAKQTADEAVEQIDTAVANAGFTSLDETISSVQTISNQAQINAGTAIDNALEAMNTASLAVENTGSLNVRVDEVEDTLSIKADKQTVDDLTGVVDLHTLDIKANADGLALKANQDTVDLIDGRVSSLGTEVGVVAGQVNSRVWKTDIESALDGIEVGGRNLLLDSQNISFASSTREDYLGKNAHVLEAPSQARFISPREQYSGGTLESYQPYTFSFLATYTGEKGSSLRLYSGLETYTNVENYENVQEGKWTRVYVTHSTNKEVEPRIHITYNGTGKLYLADFKVEKGTVATDWTPAPEDTDAKITHIETEFTQKYDSITSTVSGLDGRVAIVRQDLDNITSTVADHTGKISTTEQTVHRLQNTVYDPETGLTSVNTQLANLVNIAVTGEEMSSAISAMEDILNLRLVAKDEIITQINLSEEGILLDAAKVHIGSSTTIDDGIITNRMVASDISADKITVGTLNAANVRVINLDFDTAVGNRTEFVQSAWNNGVDNVTVDGSGMYMTGSGTWRRTYLTATGFDLYNGSGGSNKAGAIGYFKEHANSANSNENYMRTTEGGQHFVGIGVNSSHSFVVGYNEYTSASNGFDRALVVSGRSGAISLLRSTTMGNGMRLRFTGGSYIGEAANSQHFNINAKGQIRLYNSIDSLKVRIGANVDLYSDLNMNSNNIYNNSDRNLKKNISSTKLNSLNAIKEWEFVDYEWIDESKEGIYMGVIAQDTPELAVYNSESNQWSINSSKQIMMNSHAIQQLAFMEENTNFLASENRTLIEKLQEENKELRNEIQKLKEAA